MFKLLIPFDNLGQAEFLARSQGIKGALTTEPALTRIPNPWPAPYPSRVVLETAFDEYETAFDASIDGGRLALDTRNMKRNALTTVLKDLAPYFESVAKAADDITLLDITGYEVRQPNQPTPNPLPAPTLSLRRSSLSGVIIAKAGRVDGAHTYETQTCTGDPSVEANWTDAAITTAGLRIELTGLTAGQLYYVRTRVLGANGYSAWSDVANLMAA